MQYTLRDNEDLDRALRKFRRLVQRAGIFRDIKKHRFYEKPSEARRRKRKTAAQRRRRSRRRQESRR